MIHDRNLKNFKFNKRTRDQDINEYQETESTGSGWVKEYIQQLGYYTGTGRES